MKLFSLLFQDIFKVLTGLTALYMYICLVSFFWSIFQTRRSGNWAGLGKTIMFFSSTIQTLHEWSESVVIPQKIKLEPKFWTKGLNTSWKVAQVLFKVSSKKTTSVYWLRAIPLQTILSKNVWTNSFYQNVATHSFCDCEGENQNSSETKILSYYCSCQPRWNK